MTRLSFNLVAGLAVCGTLLSVSLATAGDKKGLAAAVNKSSASSGAAANTSAGTARVLKNTGVVSQFNGNALNLQNGNVSAASRTSALKNLTLTPVGGGNGGGSSSFPGKVNIDPSRVVGGLVTTTGGGNGGGSSTFPGKVKIDPSRIVGGLVTTGGGNGGGGSGGGSGFPGNVKIDPSRIVGGLAINPVGGGNGGGSGKFPGNVKIDPSRIVGGLTFNPVGGGNTPPADPGQGGGGGGGGGNNPPANPPCDPPHCPPKDKCHPYFPWCPIVVDVHHGCYPVYYPTYPSITVVQQPVVQTFVAAAPVAASVDLALVEVRLVDAGDAAKKLGPRYRMSFTNRGSLPVGNFQAILMASREATPAADNPSATAEIARLGAGETSSVDIRLPATADLSALPVLIVAVDSAMQIAETDETNNVACFNRASIASAE